MCSCHAPAPHLFNMTNPYKKLSKISPQIGKGHTSRTLASGIWNALVKACLSGPEYQIVLFIINQTWGWGKDMDDISYGQFEALTAKTRRGCINFIHRLEYMHIIYIKRKVVKGHSPLNSYGFNKHYDTWRALSGEPLFTTQEVKLVNLYSLLTPKSGEPTFTKSGERNCTKVVNTASHNKHTNKNKEKELPKKKKDSLFVQKVHKDMKGKKPMKMKTYSPKIEDI